MGFSAGHDGEHPPLVRGHRGRLLSGAMSWITPGRQGGLLRTAKAYGAIADGNSHPLSAVYPGISLAAAQAAFPNANVTALTQEVDTCALLQLEHDFGGQDRYWDGGVYVVDQLVVVGPSLQQGGRLSGAGQAGGGGGGTLLRAKTGAGLSQVVAIDSQYTSIENIGIDGHSYTASFSRLLTAGGAAYGWWPRNCAYSNMRNLSAVFCSTLGLFLDSSTKSGGGLGVSDGVVWDTFVTGQNGTLEIQSLVGTATSGTFTITVTNYLGTQTTGNIAFNASAATILAALAALTTVNPTGDQNGQCLKAGITGLPANTNGPLGTNPVYLVFTGALLGPQSVLTINTGGLGGGTVTCTRIQVGVVGGGIGWGGGVDNNDQKFTKPRGATNFGDGLIFNGGVNSYCESPDMEFNDCCGIRWTSAGATVLTGNDVGGAPYTEGNWQSFYSDTLGGTHSQGCRLDRTNASGTGSMLYQGGTFNVDIGTGNGVLIINGQTLTVP